MNVPPKKDDRKISGPRSGGRTKRVPLLFTPEEIVYYDARAKARGVTMAKLLRDALRLAEGHPDQSNGDGG